MAPAALARLALLAGIVLGGLGFIAMRGAAPPTFAWSGGGPVPSSPVGAAVVLFAGGLAMGVGARTAGGCTSGHGVCGIARLSARSIAATAIFMATAIVTVAVMRHGFGG